MNIYKIIFPILFCLTTQALRAQLWQQNDAIFNSSGVPSLSFSQPRFADLDGDGDQDMILGSINDAPFYFENTGSAVTPVFTPGPDIFALVSSLDAEMAVCKDLDNDGDLDLISGGYTGLNYYENIGSAEAALFQQIDNFFSNLSTGQNPVTDLADVDGDGDLDLVTGFSENGTVKIYFNIGTEYNAEFSESDVLVIGDVGLYAYPHFCDLDADGDEDIVVGRDSHGFVYYENTGTPQNGNWQANNAVLTGLGNDSYWNSPGIADLNGDGTFDLIFGNAAGPLQYYENGGTPEDPDWLANTELFGGIIDVGGASNPVFYDFDNDGDLDLVSGSNLGNIKYYENTGTSNSPAWSEDSGYFSGIDHSIYSAITLGDVNNNGLADAIVGDLSGNLYFHENNGTGFTFHSDVLSSVSLGGWSAPRLFDLDDDGDLDIIAGNEAGNLFYFENQGTPEDPDWVEIVNYFGGIDVGTNCVPTIGDLTLNNNYDLITGNLWGEVQFFSEYHGNWVEDPDPVSGLSGGQNTTPALADLDNDGDLDLILGNYNGTFNYFENLTFIVNSDPEMIPDNPLKLTNYPNPFNPNTTISFNLITSLERSYAEQTETGQEPELVIYNLKGQQVKVFDKLPKGITETIEIVWNGRNDAGNPVSSGIYFCRLKSGQYEVSRKLVLMK
jgi:hypothetical protein